MLTQIKRPKRYLSTYYHNNSLLVQFVLSEFIAAHQLALQIKELTHKDLESTQTLQSLFQCLSQLLDLAPDKERYAISRWTKGPLTKLNHYCKQFYRNAPDQDKRNLTLYIYVHKTWLSAVQLWELLHAFQPAQTPASAAPTIKRALKHFNGHMGKIAKYISRAIRPFSNDENVLFFLFRKKTQLEEIYGVDFIDKIFKMPIREIFPLLIQRYVQRGFDHLVSSIHSA